VRGRLRVRGLLRVAVAAMTGVGADLAAVHDHGAVRRGLALACPADLAPGTAIAPAPA